MARFASILVAAWLLYSGVVVDSLRESVVPLWMVGLVVLFAEIVALRYEAVRWVSFVAGAALLFAPLLLDYTEGLAVGTALVSGVLLLTLAPQATRPSTYDHIPTYLQALYRYQGGGRPYR